MSKKIILVALAMVLALALVGCTAQNSLAGTTWKIDGTSPEQQIAFGRDKSCTFSEGGASTTGTWSATGNDLILDIPDIGRSNQQITTEIKGLTMKWTYKDNSDVFTLTRIK